MARQGFRGNIKIKPIGFKEEWTAEQIKEFIKCRDDVFYFIKKYFMIVTENGLEHMVLRPYQIEMIKSMRDGRFTLAVWSRQSGKSECFRAFLTHYILFNEYKTVAIVANKESAAVEILSKIQISYQNLPRWMQQGIQEYNKGSFILENGSRIFASATSKDALRGYTVHVLVVDEAAHVENWEEFYGAVQPTISAGKETKLILASTPNGLNHFYNIYEGSSLKKNTNGFTSIFVPWWKVPGRDEAWKDATLKQLNFDMVKFEQEYCVSFIGSSNTLIMGWKLEALKASVHEPLNIIDNNLFIYEYPIKEPRHKYALVADVSRGKGLDYSAFNVFDITSIPYRQVAVFKNNEITPTDFSSYIYKTAELYNEAVVLTEINDIGEQVGTILLEEYGYEHVLCSEGSGRGGKKLCYNHSKADKGIRTTAPLKMSGCLLLKLLLEQNKMELYDEATINELLVFVKDKNTYKAEKTYHDDLAITLVIFAWLSDQEYFKENYELNTVLNMAEKNLQSIEDNMIPVGYSQPRTHGLFEEFASIKNTLNREFHYWEDGYQDEPPKVIENCDEAYEFFFGNKEPDRLPLIQYDKFEH